MSEPIPIPRTDAAEKLTTDQQMYDPDPARTVYNRLVTCSRQLERELNDLKALNAKSSFILGRIGDDLEQERKILNRLAWLCDQYQEGRIAHEIGNASRALTEAIELIKFYQSGEKLPTLEELSHSRPL